MQLLNPIDAPELAQVEQAEIRSGPKCSELELIISQNPTKNTPQVVILELCMGQNRHLFDLLVL